MDSFDTVPIIPDGPITKDDPRHPFTAAQQAAARTSNTVGRLLAGPAARWKASDDRRKAARTDEALAKIREANRAHREAMRDVRRDRKAFETARSEVSWWNVFNGERRAAATVVRDSRELAREARDARREARRAYPLSLPSLAVRCHAAHLIPVAVWQVVADTYLSAGALTLSATAAFTNYLIVKHGTRYIETPVAATPVADELTPSQEERDLLQRLDPTAWQGVAAPRGLGDVLTSGATLTESGIQVKLTLNGTMDLPTLRKREPQLRAALRLREGTRMELREGATGGHVRMTLRTRSAAAGLDMTGWWPGAAWAVNTITGETVKTPLGKRMLIAGTSGSGKSWSARPLMAEASEYEDHRLVIFDRKHIEGKTWNHRARVVVELEEMDELCDELTAEGEERLKTIPRGRDTVEISPARPRITVFVDEGGELISDCVKEFERIIDRLRTIARKYRAAEIILVWATQKPSMSGKGHGIDSQISGQMTDRLSLAVATPGEARVVFGDDATENGWKSNELPMPGFALYRQQELGPKSIPQMLQMRAMSPQQVIDLPDRPIWSRTVSSTGATKADIDARKDYESNPLNLWAELDVDPATVVMQKKPRVAAEDRDDQIMEELAHDPCRSLSSIATAIDASKSVVKRRLEQMEADGLVCRDEDGCWHVSP